jgi:hypothetical protein
VRCIAVTGQSITDCIPSLPSSLEDCHLRTAEVHHPGWYAEPALERVEELAPAILKFLPEMLIGQKVMILDTDGHKPGGRI